MSKRLLFYLIIVIFVCSLNYYLFMNNYSFFYIRHKKFKIYFYFCAIKIYKIIMFI